MFKMLAPKAEKAPSPNTRHCTANTTDTASTPMPGPSSSAASAPPSKWPEVPEATGKLTILRREDSGADGREARPRSSRRVFPRVERRPNQGPAGDRRRRRAGRGVEIMIGNVHGDSPCKGNGKEVNSSLSDENGVRRVGLGRDYRFSSLRWQVHASFARLRRHNAFTDSLWCRRPACFSAIPRAGGTPAPQESLDPRTKSTRQTIKRPHGPACITRTPATTSLSNSSEILPLLESRMPATPAELAGVVGEAFRGRHGDLSDRRRHEPRFRPDAARQALVYY